MSAAATSGDMFHPAPRWSAGRRWTFSPFDPNTPHLRFAVVSILVLWLIVLSTISFLPKQFASKATLIIPGAAPSVNVSLDRIGQTSTSSSAAYNTVALSPKVIYKEMLLSDDVRGAAAASLGMTVAEFGAPRIKLIDETALINIELRGRLPRDIHRRHVALITALQQRLDRLRSDELEKRTATVRENLQFYEASLADARAKITALQSRTGLQSEAQFTEIALTLVRRTQRLAELRAESQRVEQERATLALRVGVDPATAATALRMVADPTLVKRLQDFADSEQAYQIESKRLGDQSPWLLQLKNKRDTTRDSLMLAQRRFGVQDGSMIELLMLMTTQSQQADLMKQLVATEGIAAGRRAELAITTADVATLETEHARLGKAASELEDLKKAQQVADSVFSTAMARINTTRSDIYGSYPLVQTLAAPSLPDQPTGTHGLYGVAGGVLGTLILALAWFLAWLRTGSGLKTSRSA